MMARRVTLARQDPADIEEIGGYPVNLEPDDDGGFVATLPDIGYGATQGDNLTGLVDQAADFLDEAVLGMMAHGEEVPLPSPARGRVTVSLPALTAAKVEVYRAMRAAGLNKSQLAEKLGWQPSQVTRLFDGRHASRLSQIETALRVLGRRFVVSSESDIDLNGVFLPHTADERAAPASEVARMVEEVLQANAPRPLSPAEIRTAIRRDKGVAMAFTSIRRALGQLGQRRVAEDTWRYTDVAPQRRGRARSHNS